MFVNITSIMDLILGLILLLGYISLSDQKISSHSQRTKLSPWDHTVAAVAYDIDGTVDTFTPGERGEIRKQRSVEGDSRTSAPQQWATTRSAAATTNFCPIEITPENRHLFEFNSTCFICSISEESRDIACPNEFNVIGGISRGCVVEKGVFSFEGCSFRCQPTGTHEEECCPGFWGTSCLECPGGASNPCSSHGQCDEAKEGTGACTCEDGYSGVSCEVCNKTSCPMKPSCTLANTTNCHKNATCHQGNDGLTFCQCQDGFYGNGMECYPTNPCWSNNGGCPANTSACIQDGPNKHHCECRQGYKDFQSGRGCNLIDMCSSDATPPPCPDHSQCETVEPGTAGCRCLSGYLGNGQTCYGNIMQRLVYLDAEDDVYRGRLTKALKLFEVSGASRLLEDRDVFYTVFVPVNEAEQFTNTKFAGDLEAGLMSVAEGRSVAPMEREAKLHLVPGYLDAHSLERVPYIYTLTGRQLIVTQNSSQLAIQLQDETDVSRVLRSDFPASNGVLHIIDSVMLATSTASTETEESIIDLLSSYDNLGTMAGYIKSVPSLWDRLDSPEISATLFAVPDEAWQVLSPNLKSLLISRGLWTQFIHRLIMQHISRTEMSAHDLMKVGEIQNTYGNTFTIKVSEIGQIIISGLANLTTLDVQASNGVIHIIDGFLLHAPSDCSANRTTDPCCLDFLSEACILCPGGCSGNGQCDTEQGQCVCGEAFEGPECESCRGRRRFGIHCNQTCDCKNGRCDAGPHGTGQCVPGSCHQGFEGVNCDRRSAPCGPQQDQCHTHSRCVNDTCECYRGYEGSGRLECLPINPCLQPDEGNCDTAVAECIHTGPGTNLCRCRHGDQEEGASCTSRDRCIGNNGGCHPNATCQDFAYLQLRQVDCQCKEGYRGNGYMCEPINACFGHSDVCDHKAKCISTGPGTHECECPPGLMEDQGHCASNLAVELSGIIEAGPFWDMVQNAELDGYLAQVNVSIGVVIPPPSILQLLSNKTKGHQGNKRVQDYFVRSNIFFGDFSEGAENETFLTLQPGETVTINGLNKNLSVVQGFVSRVKSATNGKIFLPYVFSETYWLDRLELLHDMLPALTTPGGDVQDYDQAWAWIQASGVLPSDPSIPFTVFLPDNTAMAMLNSSALEEQQLVESHLVLGEAIFYSSLLDGQNVTTEAGHLLQVTPVNRTVYLKTTPIETPDIIILPSSVAHGIPSPLTTHQRKCLINGSSPQLEGNSTNQDIGDCHSQARCVQISQTEGLCFCSEGYHGDGEHCRPTNPCLHDNGGCHYRAECLRTARGERICRCRDDYQGDGFTCYGSVLEELKGLSEASQFVEFLPFMGPDSFLSEGLFTLFVPTNDAVQTFLQNEGLENGKWHDINYNYQLSQLVLQHVVCGSRLTVADLSTHPTLGAMNGQDFTIQAGQDGNITLNDIGLIVMEDQPASNGVIHLIDAMLSPSIMYQNLPTFSTHQHSGDINSHLYQLGTTHNITIFVDLMNRTRMARALLTDLPRPGSPYVEGGPRSYNSGPRLNHGDRAPLVDPHTPQGQEPPRGPPMGPHRGPPRGPQRGPGSPRGPPIGPARGPPFGPNRWNPQGGVGGHSGIEGVQNGTGRPPWEGSFGTGGPRNGPRGGRGRGGPGGMSRGSWEERNGTSTPGWHSGAPFGYDQRGLRGRAGGRSDQQNSSREMRIGSFSGEMRTSGEQDALVSPWTSNSSKESHSRLDDDDLSRENDTGVSGRGSRSREEKRSSESQSEDEDDTNRHRIKRSGGNGPRYGRPFWARPGMEPGHGFGGRERDSTVLAPTDEAFQALPPGKLEELQDPRNWVLLEEFIAHHVLTHEYPFYDLWPEDGSSTLETLQGSDDLRLAIDEGRLHVNEMSRVIGVGLEFEGGVLYPVSHVIAMPNFNGRCDIITKNIKMSRCKPCDAPEMCPPGPQAVQVGEIRRGCRYKMGWYNSREGCQAECEFTEVTRACCPGFYGPSCQECPGGSAYPCSRHGECSAGMDRDGQCSCREGFTGTACEKCLPGRYGPSCRECRCSNSSICLSETGECFCDADMTGRYCDIPLDDLPTCTPPCHHNAICRPGNTCQCLPQYHGNGYTCNAINRCFSDNGGCSLHATCTHDPSALYVNCSCHDGFHGDGVICLPVNECETENGGCHPNATCTFRGPKARTCVCKPPYWGDGFNCNRTMPSCQTNNGGCSPNAQCQEGQNGGPRTCSCLPGYVGDGFHCNSNTYQTIATNPEFFYFYTNLTKFANRTHKGRRLLEDLKNPSRALSVFIPVISQETEELDFLPSQVLLHTVRGRLSMDHLRGRGKLETWSGQEIQVEVMENHYHESIVTIEGVRVLVADSDIPTTNGMIHFIAEPLPVWEMVDYDRGVDEQTDQHWSSSSRIFALVSVPFGVLAFLTVVALYWLRSRKIRSASLGGNVQVGTVQEVGVAAEDDTTLTTISPQQATPPSSPASPASLGGAHYSELDQLMSDESRKRAGRHKETNC